MRDFLASGACKGLHTPHTCTPDPLRITLPRFFTVRPAPPPPLTSCDALYTGRPSHPLQRQADLDRSGATSVYSLRPPASLCAVSAVDSAVLKE